MPAARPLARLARPAGQGGWHLLRNVWETIVWSNVRAGSVQLRGTPLSFRVLMRFGLWLTIGLLAGLLAADLWRLASPLLPLIFYSDSLSGLYAPRMLVPVVIGLFALAWTYLLVGALHAPAWIALVVWLLFLLFDAGFAVNLLTGLLSELGLLLAGLRFSLWTSLATLVHVTAWLLLIATALLRRPRAPRLGLEFPILLGLVALLLFSSYFGNLIGNRAFESETVSTALQLTQALQALSTFLMPFLLIAGAEAAEFGMTVTEQITARVRRASASGARWGWVLLATALAGFLVLRLFSQWIVPAWRREVSWSWGAGLIAVIVLIALALRRPAAAAADSVPAWVVPVAALALYASLFVIQLLSLVEIGAAVVSVLLGRGGGGVLRGLEALYGYLVRWNEAGVGALAVLLGLGLAARARWRGRPVPAASRYAVLFGVWLIVWTATRQGEWLDALEFQYQDLAAVATPILLAALAALVLARRLSPRALTYLTAVALLLWILEFQSWLSDPLSPLSGWLGVEAVFLSVSIFLNVMAAGNRFGLNAETARFPRASRGMLYFGYALLTVTNLNWLAAAHDVSAMSLQDQIARNGFTAIGLPLAFLAILTANRELLGESAVPTQ
ncbi:MAG: hypothetical protein IT318_25280 [Anaerolineales bacterium]|nr:hypothetical protein [Anaerolineales bacterium]